MKVARDSHAAAESHYKAIDDKSAGITSLVGSGAGLLTLGSIAAISAGQLNPWVAVFATPSFVSATLALVFATLARRPQAASDPQMARRLVEVAEHYPTANAAEASTIPSLHTSRPARFGGSTRKRSSGSRGPRGRRSPRSRF